MSALSVIKTVYRAVVPPSIRASRPMILAEDTIPRARLDI